MKEEQIFENQANRISRNKKKMVIQFKKPVGQIKQGIVYNQREVQ